MSLDPHAGFEARIERHRRLVRIRLWGQWRIATCRRFCETMLRFAAELEGQRWTMFVDSRGFSAQSQEITRLRQETMAKVAKMDCAKLAAITHQPVYAMQLRRIADPSGLPITLFN
ncbi:MAG TPA: hypothetical protein VK841_08415, partial [Polyangiaceae bacterium]|nr:hypothetical protein [Polyangiaceae bacterium]